MKSATGKLATLLLFSCALAACGGGGGGSTPPAPTPTPTQSPGLGATCLANGQSAVRTPQSSSGVVGADGMVRFMPGRAGTPYVPGQLAVQYRSSQSNAADRALQSVTRAGNGDVITDLHFPNSNLSTRVVRVNDADMDSTARTLRQQPGVLRVDRVGARYEMSSQPDFLNDPYFWGKNTVPPGQPPGPLFASPTYPGQWDMHIIGMENVFGYRNSGNIVPANPNALGSASIKLAIIDTGADVTLTDIGPANSPRIARTQCYITANGVQSHTQNVSDFDGHGTNVTGIAAANTKNGFGFVGSGGNVSLMLYRIFPSGANSQASAADEISAINDAVTNGANVISLSLGDPQQDPNEAAAIANAIASSVTVVAASGNEKATALDFPAGYPGVIAVGASAIDDNGAERVASYSNYVPGDNMWGLIAPGGDPTTPSIDDSDFLHWIENAYSLRATQPCHAASGQPDFFGETGNCNVLIAGTSQATPHVAGAVAMLFSVAGVMNPANAKAALLNSAHDISDPKQGAGRLNEYRLIAKALNDPTLPPK